MMCVGKPARLSDGSTGGRQGRSSTGTLTFLSYTLSLAFRSVPLCALGVLCVRKKASHAEGAENTEGSTQNVGTVPLGNPKKLGQRASRPLTQGSEKLGQRASRPLRSGFPTGKMPVVPVSPSPTLRQYPFFSVYSVVAYPLSKRGTLKPTNGRIWGCCRR